MTGDRRFYNLRVSRVQSCILDAELIVCLVNDLKKMFAESFKQCFESIFPPERLLQINQ